MNDDCDLLAPVETLNDSAVCIHGLIDLRQIIRINFDANNEVIESFLLPVVRHSSFLVAALLVFRAFPAANR